MNFVMLPWTAVVAGLAGLAAALYVLQQLRTRYRDVTVVTTLFWKQVVDEAPVRKFRERFRHPLAYALILAICSLIWLGFAEPQFAAASDDTFHVLVLDASAGMAAAGRFDSAVRELTREAARLPVDRRQVIWSGGELRSLLAPGEHVLLLQKRLERLAPEPAPASVERLLRQLSAVRRAGQTSVVVFGDAPVRRQVLDLVPASITVGRAAQPQTLVGNAGITALGVSDAASGAWDRVDVLIDVQSSGDGAAMTAVGIRITLDGQPVPDAVVSRTARPGGYSLLVRDLPAAGGLLAARLGAPDTLPVDDAASLRLPSKPILKVMLSASLQREIGPVLKADSGVTVVTASPDVVIRRSGETAGGGVPALEFVQTASQPQAFVLTHPAAFESDLVLADAVEEIGLAQIDAMSLAQDTGRRIEVSIALGQQWRFSVWDELLSEHYNFTRSRAFPLFVANAVRWLAGTPAWYAEVAAGRPLVAAASGNPDRIVNTAGRILDPLGAPFVPPRAEELKIADVNRTLTASLLDPSVTRGVLDSAVDVAALAPVTSMPGPDVATWLLLLAIGLLSAEWYWFQRGRLP